MAGLLGAAMGALGGAGEAVQTNAKLELQKRKEEALLGVRHKYSMAQQQDQQQFSSREREAGQQYSTEERIAGQQYTSGENALNRSHQTRQTQIQQAGANSRARLGLLQMGRDGEGNIAYYNPATGDLIEPPQGWDPVSGGTMSDLQKAQAKHLQNQIQAIDKQLYDSSAPLGEDQAEKLEVQRNQLTIQLEGMLDMGGGTDGGSLADDVAGMRGGNSGTDPSGNNGPSLGLLEQARQNKTKRQEQVAASARSDEIDDTLDSLEARANHANLPRDSASNGLLGGAGVGGQPLTPEQRQAMIQQVQALEGELSPRQRAQALRLIEQLNR